MSQTRNIKTQSIKQFYLCVHRAWFLLDQSLNLPTSLGRIEKDSDLYLKNHVFVVGDDVVVVVVSKAWWNVTRVT